MGIAIAAANARESLARTESTSPFQSLRAVQIAVMKCCSGASEGSGDSFIFRISKVIRSLFTSPGAVMPRSSSSGTL